ncbi:MAG: acetoin utilization protein AcuC [Pseudomonadota bacterium]
MSAKLSPLFISSEIYRDTGYGSNHPLAIQRVGAVLDLCDALGWFEQAPYTQSQVATEDELLKFHNADYLAALRQADQEGRASPEVRRRYGLGTRENPVFNGMFERSATSVGGSIQAARLAMEGRTVFHPSGGTHHGMPDRAHGFCYFNDPVFAVLTFLEEGAERVLYLDLDAHHGDGVQHAFLGDEQVRTLSIHEENRWPNSGLLEDRGRGYAFNLPVSRLFNDSELAFVSSHLIGPLLESFAPEAVVVCCGADGLSGDPLSAMELSNAGLWDAVAAVTGSLPAVVLGGGGYNPWTTSRCWTYFWGKIAGFEIPETLPEPACARLVQMECDLVDDEDVEPAWLNKLEDERNTGHVRECLVQRVEHLAARVMR